MDDPPDFQTMNMIYKMKKIKKKKSQNIQKIKPLEVLDNLPKEVEPEYFAEETVVEGMRGIPDNDPRYWDGLDDINSDPGKDKGIITKNLSDWINKAYITIIKLNCFIAINMASNAHNEGNNKIISWTTMEEQNLVYVDSENAQYGETLNNSPISVGTGSPPSLSQEAADDANALYQYICYFEALVSAYFFTFIWYYVIFYCYFTGQPQGSFFDNISREKLRENTNPFMMFLLFIFEYAIVILDDVRWFLDEVVPHYVSMVLNKPLCFIVLFMIIFHFNHKYLSYFKGFLIDILNGNYINFFVPILYFIVISEYIGSYNLRSKFKGLASSNQLERELSKASLLSEAFTTYLTSNLATVIFGFIKELIRLILIFIFAVPTGCLLCIIYFLWTSIVTNFKNLVFDNNNFGNMYDFIRSDTSDDSLLNDPCNVPTTFWEKFWFGVKNGFLYLATFVFSYFFYIITIFYCVYVLISGLGQFNGNLMQQLVESFHIILLFVILGLLLLQVRRFMKQMGSENLNLFNVLIRPPILESMKNTTKNIGYVILGFSIIFILFIIIGSSIILDASVKNNFTK
jgi:hypothetical protein